MKINSPFSWAPWVLALAVVAGTWLPSTLALAAPSPRAVWVESPALATTESDVRVYLIGGNVRPNVPNASAGWHIIDDANHDTLDLTGVTCLSTGLLRISYPTALRVGVLQGNADEAWAGKFEIGGSQGFGYTDFKITNGTGTKVDCDSSSLTNAGNWTMWGFMFRAS